MVCCYWLPLKLPSAKLQAIDGAFEQQLYLPRDMFVGLKSM